MSRSSNFPLFSSQAEQQSPIYNPPQSQPFQQQQQQQQPVQLSFLQRAIQQSDQQFNMNQTSSTVPNEFSTVPLFQPFDLLPPNAYPGFPIGSVMNQAVLQHQQQQQQQSPAQPNNIRLSSPQAASSPNTSHTSPPSQPQTPQQMNSPRMSGGSTLQFVPSQVLRNMSKNHK